jgi:hypothetical protein
LKTVLIFDTRLSLSVLVARVDSGFSGFMSLAVETAVASVVDPVSFFVGADPDPSFQDTIDPTFTISKISNN